MGYLSPVKPRASELAWNEELRGRVWTEDGRMWWVERTREMFIDEQRHSGEWRGWFVEEYLTDLCVSLGVDTARVEA